MVPILVTILDSIVNIIGETSMTTWWSWKCSLCIMNKLSIWTLKIKRTMALASIWILLTISYSLSVLYSKRSGLAGESIHMRPIYGRWILKWLIFLIGLLYLVGMWFGKDQRANVIKTNFSRTLDYVFIYQ